MNRHQFEEPEPQAAAVSNSNTTPASSMSAAAEPEGVGAVLDPSGVMSLPTPVSPQMDPQESEAFLARLREQARRQRSDYRLMSGGFSGGALFFSLLALNQAMRWLPLSPGIPLAACMLYITFLIGMRKVAVRWMKTSDAMAKSADVRMVGPLIEAYSSLNLAEYRDPVREALIRLLSRLQSSDARVLTEEHRHALNRVLGSGTLSSGKENNRLIIAILKAYEQVGDESALPFVERLAEGEKAGKNREVREAAQACLPFLQERVELERSRQTLLRAASASDTPSDVLLRPASGALEADPQQLLRATASDEA
jgi:hypothetical protein